MLSRLMRLAKSFYFRLACGFLLVLLALGVCQVLLYRHYSKQFLEETYHLFSEGKATVIAQRLKPLLTPTVDYVGVYDVLLLLQEESPELHSYLLWEDGSVFLSLGREQAQSASVPSETLVKLLEQPSNSNGAQLGVDPRVPDTLRPVAVAPVQIGRKPGYVYLVFGSTAAGLMSDVVQSSFVMKASLFSMVVSLGLAALLGAVLFFFLTRRLARITSAVNRFSEGDLSSRIGESSDDELGALAATFDSMAGRLSEHIRHLEKTERLRTEVISTIAHDLLGPVGVAKGYAEALQENVLDLQGEKLQQAYTTIYGSMNYLGNLVHELFEVVRLESRDIVPKIDVLHLMDFLDVMEMRFVGAAEREDIRFSIKRSEQLPAVLGDEALIERVMSNLIGNGIKYSPPGSEVWVETAVQAEGVEIAVCDSGEGIPAEALPTIFDKFARGPGELARKKGGTGLGLAIVKKILDAHEVPISVESEVGKGTKFWFCLPFAK